MAPKEISGPFNGSPNRLFLLSLPVCQEVLDISQIAVPFHGIRPPLFLQVSLQQYRRSSFVDSAHRSLSNTIRLGSIR